MWEHRNGILHQGENLRRSQDLDSRIAEHFRISQPLLPLSEQHWFRLPLHDVQRKSVHQKRLWVASVDAAVTYFSS